MVKVFATFKTFKIVGQRYHLWQSLWQSIFIGMSTGITWAGRGLMFQRKTA